MPHHAEIESFFAYFENGDVEAARTYLQRRSTLAGHTDYRAHPVLLQFINRNDGHCYKKAHLLIADLLIPWEVQIFREAVLADRLEDIRRQLAVDPALISAEFTAGRGIAQAIHHWRSPAVGALLLNGGADINVATTVHVTGETPLMMQLRFGTADGVRLLLERGADPHLGGLKHLPSPSMAELLKLLLDYGWDINEGAGTRTMMHHDANHGHGMRIRVLLDHGAEPDVKDADGRTALHILAARGVGKDAIRALIEAGADMDARDRKGRMPLDLARAAKRQTAAKTLMALGAKRT